MSSVRGRYFRLSLPRRWIGDVLHFARKQPSVPVERTMALGEVQAIRQQVAISWPALFLKAFGIVSQEYPELRQALLSFPWTRCYEHPVSVASVAIERMYEGEPAVFFGQVQAPESQSLGNIDQSLKQFKTEPIESIGTFRRLIQITKWPRILRRFAWWMTLNWTGEKRAKRLGTFGMSVYASLGASSLHPLSPLSYLLNYGVMDEQGRVSVRLVYDHRIVDGAVVARALASMESALTGPLLDELIRTQHLLTGSDKHATQAIHTERRNESLVSR